MGQSSQNIKTKTSPVTSHDDSVAHFLSQNTVVSITGVQQEKQSIS